MESGCDVEEILPLVYVVKRFTRKELNKINLARLLGLVLLIASA